jgi:hypothetical protein
MSGLLDRKFLEKGKDPFDDDGKSRRERIGIIDKTYQI